MSLLDVAQGKSKNALVVLGDVETLSSARRLGVPVKLSERHAARLSLRSICDTRMMA